MVSNCESRSGALEEKAKKLHERKESALAATVRRRPPPNDVTFASRLTSRVGADRRPDVVVATAAVARKRLKRSARAQRQKDF